MMTAAKPSRTFTSLYIISVLQAAPRLVLANKVYASTQAHFASPSCKMICFDKVHDEDYRHTWIHFGATRPSCGIFSTSNTMLWEWSWNDKPSLVSTSENASRHHTADAKVLFA